MDREGLQLFYYFLLGPKKWSGGGSSVVGRSLREIASDVTI
jgi:hypothetical protein